VIPQWKGFLLYSGKVYFEGRSLAGLAVNPDVAPALLDDPIKGRKQDP